MLQRDLHDDTSAADKLIVIALASLLTVSLISAVVYVGLDSDEEDSSNQKSTEWVDPVVEIEDEYHSHTDLLAHRLQSELYSLFYFLCFAFLVTLLSEQYQLIYPEMNKFTWQQIVSYVVSLVLFLAILWISLGRQLYLGYYNP